MDDKKPSDQDEPEILEDDVEADEVAKKEFIDDEIESVNKSDFTYDVITGKVEAIPKLGDSFEDVVTLQHQRYRTKTGDTMGAALFLRIYDIDKGHFYLSMCAFNLFLVNDKLDINSLPLRDKKTQLVKSMEKNTRLSLWNLAQTGYLVTRRLTAGSKGLWHRFESPMLPNYTKKEQQVLIVFRQTLCKEKFEEILKEVIPSEYSWITRVDSTAILPQIYKIDAKQYRIVFCESPTDYYVYYECAPVNDFYTYLSAPDSIPKTAVTDLGENFSKIVLKDVSEEKVCGTLSKTAIGTAKKRPCSQNKVMGGISASEFAKKVKKSEWDNEISNAGFKLKDTKWEWLHIYAFSYGQAKYPPDSSFHTPQDARNLVVGTANENTSMLVVESLLKELTRAGAKVSIEATTKKIQIQGESMFCACATELIEYNAGVSIHGKQLQFSCGFLPFSSSPVPMVAAILGQALAKVYRTKIFPLLAEKESQMSID